MSIKEQRYSKFLSSLRCLDCKRIDVSIQYVESPVSSEQKALIQKLLRKGLSDYEIYKEYGRIYGKNSVLECPVLDPESRNSFETKFTMFLFNPLIIIPITIIGGFSLRYAIRKFRKKL